MNITTPVAPGHVYEGCWGKDFKGPNTAMLHSHIATLLYGWRELGMVQRVQISAPVTTNWLPGCRHDLRHIDPSCEGCKNRNDGL